MSIAGIIAEYNPFHTGHAHQIAQTKARLGEDCAVVTVMSGNWTQQAGCAVADKWTRARLALMGGADLVLELPTVWAASSAESFAWGGISLLHACGVVDALSFGSESGELDGLIQLAACLDSAPYRERLPELLSQGLSFPAARQQAAAALVGDAAELLSLPNNNLGIEYLRALNVLHSPIHPMTIPRVGAAHNALTQDAPFLSATQLRAFLRQGDRDKAAPFLPAGGLGLLPAPSPSLALVERAILARVRTMTVQDWAALPDSGEAEGLPQRLEKAGQRCGSMEEFFSLAKTKRYTHARLRRLALWAFLDLTQKDRPAAPPLSPGAGLQPSGTGGPAGDEAKSLPAHPHKARPHPRTGRRGSTAFRSGVPVHGPIHLML